MQSQAHGHRLEPLVPGGAEMTALDGRGDLPGGLDDDQGVMFHDVDAFVQRMHPRPLTLRLEGAVSLAEQ